ncbi:MAG: hypothetical protein M1834_004215 [Cirrosporium novae-zelandiae]|nr:MAG: hypothetical protein M1834_004215 [Cirrosporium novae-zelandiae]
MTSPVPTPSATPLPDASSLKAFKNAAAGHDGVLSDSSGSLLIKPCTPAEIAFYESAAAHPDFAAHMPTYMGTLTLGNENNVSPASIADPSSTTSLKNTLILDPNAGPIPSSTPSTLSLPTPSGSAPVAWTPSSGAKIHTNSSIVLSNAAYGFRKPNILDVKLGARLWGDDAPVPKRARLDEVAAETTSLPLGFRIAGMRVWNGDNEEGEQGKKPQVSEEDKDKKGNIVVELDDGYRVYNKFYGRSFAPFDVRSGFREYLRMNDDISSKYGRPSRLLAGLFAARVKEIQETLEKEESRMYSASLLFVYEGDKEAMIQKIEDEGDVKERDENMDSDEGEEAEAQQKFYDVKLIDFAHAQWVPSQGPDENALHGIRSVRSIFEELADS